MFSLFCVSNLEVCCVEILSLRRQISFVLACDLIPIKRCNKTHCRLLRLNLTATKDCNFAEITIFDNFLVRYFFSFSLLVNIQIFYFISNFASITKMCVFIDTVCLSYQRRSCKLIVLSGYVSPLPSSCSEEL